MDCSPSPALLAWSDASSGLAWEINAAARDWALARAWTQEHWNALAAAVLECTAPTRRSNAALGVRWRSVPEAGGLLAWLMPLEPGGVEAEVQALRERVAELSGQLDAAQELGSRPGSLAVDSDSAELARRLQASSTQLALAVGLVGIVLWRYDFAAGLMQFNDQGYKLLGFKRRAEGVPLAEARGVIHPQDREQVELAAQQAVASIGVVDVEARYMTAAGTWSTQLTRRIAERDPQGKAVALVGVSMDMTEQRATQERLRQAEQRAMIAIQAASMGVWEFNLLTGEVYWDVQMYALRGLDPADSRPPALLRDLAVHPHDLPRLQQRIHDVAEEGTIYQEQYRVVWPDGSVHWLAVRGMVARDARGRGTRMFGVNWDITEHQLNEDMRRDKAAAEQASRAKSEFLAHMSHELRTPLNAVLGFAQLMLEDPGEPLERQQRLRAQRIRNAGKHLLALIDDVLDFSSMESGSLPLDREPVALGPLVQETLQWLAPAAERAGVSLHAPSSDGEVMGDERRLRQVLANLLSNAVKYNRPGGRVELALIDSAAADGMLGFSVRDTGRGLAPEQLRRLFEPFNRLGA
ncbi:MAG TPA: PAS domain-containing protein, partial [Methylibium sp.]